MIVDNLTMGVAGMAISTIAREVTPRLDAPRPYTSIGVVAPFDFALDRELWHLVPEDVTLHLTRTPYIDLALGVELASELSDEEAVGIGARALSVVWPAVTVYLCTSGSFVNGLAGESGLREAMEARGAVRAVTTGGALLEALAALGLRRVGVGTPYDRTLTVRLERFLADGGFEPVQLAYLGLTGNVPQVSTETVRELARAACTDDAEVVFLSCTNLPTIDVLAELEAELGRPVLSANLVSIWSALRSLGALPSKRPERLLRHAQSG